MKRYIAVFSIVVVAAVAPAVYAVGSLSDVALNSVRENCVSAQIAIQRVQESDKLTRINRGYRYEALLKLMANFNSRVAQNKVNAPELISITSEYQKGWNDFRANYTAYDDDMSKIINMDCRNEPTTFNDSLIDLREKRSELNKSVVTFDELLDKYQAAVGAIGEEKKEVES